MTNPNPFVPKGSLLEQQTVRRSRLKLGVFCVIAVSSLSLVAMLIQGCKREQPATDNAFPEMPTNAPTMTDTNPPVADTNTFVLPTNPPPVIVPPIAETIPGSTYEVVKGDTLTTIAKAHHVTLKDLQAANPGVDSKHLKLKQKITIPAATAPAAVSTPVAGIETAAGETYTVKTGDTLTTIAKKHGTTVKALQAANSLTTTKIKVNQKLKLPAKAEVPAPIAETTPAPTGAMPAPAPVK